MSWEESIFKIKPYSDIKMNQQFQKTSDAITGYASIFSQNDWVEFDNIVNNIFKNAVEIFETPKLGDSRNEYIDLRVARFIVRKNGHSTIVNKPYSVEILNVLTRANFIDLVEQRTRLENLKILRMQLNSMEKNSFVGIHADSENDPAYEVTAVIRITSSYSGGELVLYDNQVQIVNQQNHSIFLMDSSIEHEVKTVTNGYRNSLIVVLGKD